VSHHGRLLHGKIIAWPREIAKELRNLLMGAQFAGQELTSAQRKRYAGDQQGKETRVQKATEKNTKF